MTENIPKGINLIFCFIHLNYAIDEDPKKFRRKMKSIARISVLVALVVVTATHPIKVDSDDSIKTRVIYLDGPAEYYLENRYESTLDQYLEMSSDPQLHEQQEAQENKDEASADILTIRTLIDVKADVKEQGMYRSLKQHFKDFLKYILRTTLSGFVKRELENAKCPK